MKESFKLKRSTYIFFLSLIGFIFLRFLYAIIRNSYFKVEAILPSVASAFFVLLILYFLNKKSKKISGGVKGLLTGTAVAVTILFATASNPIPKDLGASGLGCLVGLFSLFAFILCPLFFGILGWILAKHENAFNIIVKIGLVVTFFWLLFWVQSGCG